MADEIKIEQLKFKLNQLKQKSIRDFILLKIKDKTKMRKILILMLGILLFGSVLVLGLGVTQNVTVTILPGTIDVFSPVQNAVYGDRMVAINLSMSSQVKYFKYIDNGGSLTTLCRNCNEYGFLKLKRKPFNDGFHNLTILAIFESESVYEYRNFIVDSKKPRITKTEPVRGFATGLFSVEFQEENPKSLFFNYGNEVTRLRNEQVILENCYSPKINKMRCDIEINLTDYDLQEITYWFNITDIVGQYDESKPKKINVDVSKPIINYFNYTQGTGRNARYITFFLNITELNFNKINYIDYSEGNRAKFKLLCSRLKNGICEKRNSFKLGEHDISIEILDKAGNRAVKNNITFSIV